MPSTKPINGMTHRTDMAFPLALSMVIPVATMWAVFGNAPGGTKAAWGAIA